MPPLQPHAPTATTRRGAGTRIRPHDYLDAAVAFDSLDGIDDQVDQRLFELTGIDGQRRQGLGNIHRDLNASFRRLRAQEFANVADHFGHLDCLQINGRGRREAQKLPHEAFQPVQLAADDLEATGRLCLERRGGLCHVLLQQLHVDGERTERIADFVRQPRQQAREQPLFFLRRQLRHVLSESGCQ